MLRTKNLQDVYKNFPVMQADSGSLKHHDFNKPDFESMTTFMLIEAERFWAATLLQLLSAKELEKVWFHTWSDVTLYYANFFSMNALMRLAGRSVTFSNTDNKTYKVKRTLPNQRIYEIAPSNSDHKQQWNWYYDLIKGDITDDALLREIFDIQIEFGHDERQVRQMLNYDLELGFDERHYNYDEVGETGHGDLSLFPFQDTTTALGRDEYMELATIVYCWKHTKSLLDQIAKETEFKHYWKIQINKLQHFVANAPLIPELKEWAIQELN